MLAPVDSSDEEGHTHENAVETSDQRLRSISGDDLGDSFSPDVLPESKKGGWVYEVLDRKDTDLETEDEGSSEESESAENESDDEGSETDDDKCKMISSLKDWEQSDDDKISTDLEGDEDEEGERGEEDGAEEMVPKIHKKAKDSDHSEINRNIDPSDAKKIKTNVKHPSSQQDSIPYVIKAPTSLEEFCMLLENRSDSDIVEIIHRIRINNAISLAVENRKKMQV